MLKPTNTAAEQIVNLRSVCSDIDIQIAELEAAKTRHAEVIAAFEEIATWEEVPDVVEEPVVLRNPDIEWEPEELADPSVNSDIFANSYDLTPEQLANQIGVPVDALSEDVVTGAVSVEEAPLQATKKRTTTKKSK